MPVRANTRRAIAIDENRAVVARPIPVQPRPTTTSIGRGGGGSNTQPGSYPQRVATLVSLSQPVLNVISPDAYLDASVRARAFESQTIRSVQRGMNGNVHTTNNFIHAQSRGGSGADTLPRLTGPCPTFADDVQSDTWLDELGFCINGRRNSNRDLIQSRIEHVYGVNFDHPQIVPRVGYPRERGYEVINQWSSGELAAVGNALNLMYRAFSQNTSIGFSREAMYRLFDGTTLHQGSGESILADLALGDGAAGVVPPPGVGGTGRDAFFIQGSRPPNPNRPFATDLVLHELVHVLDFRGGSTFSAETLGDLSNPSTRFYSFTQAEYDFTLMDDYCEGVLFGLCAAANIGNLGYQPGGNPPLYGYGNPPDHWEDFAESGTQWILAETSSYSGLSGTMPDLLRQGFFDSQIGTILKQTLNSIP